MKQTNRHSGLMDRLQANVALKPYNTFQLEAEAKWWYEVHSDREAIEFVMDNLHLSLPVQVLGGGSNILLTKDISGIVLKNSIRGIEVIHESDELVQVQVGAGENWHEFVLHCLDQNWGGIENLSLIPGCIGAAPIQNIGAYGVEIKDVFHSLEAVNLSTGALHTFHLEDCQFGYRDSVFKGIYKAST